VLSGLGIAKEHAVIEGHEGMLYVTPVLPAQTFVNGVPCTERTLLAHGFRLALGPTHLFRVCTTHKAEGGEEEPQMSWADAQKELALKLNADSEKDKQAALKEQADLFEGKLRELKEQGVLLDAEAEVQARKEAEAEVSCLLNSSGSVLGILPCVLPHLRIPLRASGSAT
jgi:predicted component of type VI protein secretion system